MMVSRSLLSDVRRLAEIRADWCVTIYDDADNWIRGNHSTDAAKARVRSAVDSLRVVGAGTETIAGIRARLEELADPLQSGAAQTDRRAQSVGIFATEDGAEVFALTTRPSVWVGVSDRFLIGPLLEAALSLIPPVFVLALSENHVRLIDVTAHPAESVEVHGLPRDLEHYIGLDVTGDRNTLSHLRTSEDPKVRLRQFCGAVDDAVARVLRRHDALLVIAAAEPIASIYRASVSGSAVAASTMVGNHDNDTPDQLAELAAPIIELDRRERLDRHLARFAELPARGRAIASLEDIEVAAKEGNLDTLLVDTDHRSGVPADAFDGHVSIDRVDEIVRHALASGTVIVPVRPRDLPTPDPVAAVLRHAPAPAPSG